MHIDIKSNYNNVIRLDITDRSVESFSQIDYQRSQEALNIMQQEAINISNRSVEAIMTSNNSQGESFFKKIINWFIKIKNFIVNTFKRIGAFIKRIFDVIFHKNKIKTVEVDNQQPVTPQEIEKKNEIIRTKMKTKNPNVTEEEIEKKIIKPKPTVIRVKYTMNDGNVVSSVIDVETINQYAVLEGIKSVPKCKHISENVSKLQEYNYEFNDITDAGNKIHELKTLKEMCFEPASDASKIECIKECADSFKDIKRLENITSAGDALANKIDKTISELNTLNNKPDVTENETKKCKTMIKIVNLFSSIATSYVSSVIRIMMELTRIVDADSALYGGDGAINYGVNDRISIKRSIDTYIIDMRKVTLNKNMFSSPQEYEKALDVVNKIYASIQSSGTSTITNRQLNDLYMQYLNIFVQQSTKLKMFVGKLGQNTAMSMYNFDVFKETDGSVSISCQLVIDNRKHISLSGVSVLYHSSENPNLTVLSPTIGNLQGDNGDLGNGVITKGNKLRVYASKVPVLKNGFPITTEGVFEFFTRSFASYQLPTTSYALDSSLDGLYIYPIQTSQLDPNDVYADPEHNGVMSRLFRSNTKDNCVYIETDKDIKLGSKMYIKQFVNTTKLLDMIKNYLNKQHGMVNNNKKVDI
jgi:hypothetical protein